MADATVEEIKSRINITDVVAEYIQLQKAGANFKARCPFHSEKTPSFYVTPARQIWHCFGCNTGGDAFAFLMKIENIEFFEALKILAEKAGVKLRREDPALSLGKNRLYAIAEAATQFFEENLASSKEAAEYLLTRKLAPETIREFRIGYAPNSWQQLYAYLVKQEFKADEIERVGLVVRQADNARSQKIYDRFRGRIMFPISDWQGRICGFSGRILPIFETETSGGKYVNTPETPLYNKSLILYGVDKSKHYIRECGQVVIVEGQMDFLMAWQAGCKNIVASSGTAFTADQLRLLKRVARKLVLAFDMDEAGDQATEKSVENALRDDFEISILRLPLGKDIAEFVADGGNLSDALSKSLSFMDHFYNSIFGKINLDEFSLADKIKAARAMLGKVLLLQSPIERSAWIEKIARKIEAPDHVVAEELEILSSAGRYNHQISRDIEENNSHLNEVLGGLTKIEKLSERLLALALYSENRLKVAEFLEYIPVRYQNTAKAIISDAPSELQDQATIESIIAFSLRKDYEIELLSNAAIFDDLDSVLKQEFSQCANQLKREWIRDKIKKSQLELNDELRSSPKSEKVQVILERISKLSSELK